VNAGTFIGFIPAAIHLLPQITVDGSSRSDGDEARFLEQPIHHLAGFADKGTLRRRFISAPTFAHNDDASHSALSLHLFNFLIRLYATILFIKFRFTECFNFTYYFPFTITSHTLTLFDQYFFSSLFFLFA
jgi:hypothetical protein